MDETEIHVSADVPKLRWEMVTLHGIQLGVAIIVICFAGAGIAVIAYDGLIYSLIAATSTIMVCIYLLAAQIYYKKVYIRWFIILLHIWMIIFWFADMGVIADLARWQGPPCTDEFGNGYVCRASIASIRPKAVYKTFYGTLVAGAVLGTVEVVLWILTFLLICLRTPKNPSIRTRARLNTVRRISRRFSMTPPPPPIAQVSALRRGSVPAQMLATASAGSIWDDMTPGMSRNFAEPIIPEDSESDRALRVPYEGGQTDAGLRVPYESERPASRNGPRELMGSSVSIEGPQGRGGDTEEEEERETGSGSEAMSWRVVNGGPVLSPPPVLDEIELHDVSLRE